MKVQRIDHVHAYSRNLEKAVKVFAPLLGSDFYPIFDASDYGARAAMHPLGFEFIEPSSPDGLAAKAFANAQEGQLVISLKVPNLDEAIPEMEATGAKLLAVMQIGKLREAAFDSTGTCGIMIELCEYPGDDITIAAMS